MANRIVVACAGSGKTTRLVDEVSAHPSDRILITTYTNENTENIRDVLRERFGAVPPNVKVCSWYSMLLAHGVKPYCNLVTSGILARTIALVDLPPILRGIPKSDVDRYYFTQNGGIYLDRVSDFVCLANEKTGGRVLRRLERVFDRILIDELQDLNGYDLDLLEKLFASGIEVVAVGDPRQATFVTNRSRKNAGVARSKIIQWIEGLEHRGHISVDRLAETWRSNQQICDFADGLYPNLPRTVSKNVEVTGHDGVFQIRAAEVDSYYATHRPIILRWNRKVDTMGLPAINFGKSKGRTYDRVMIFPTKGMKTYLATGDIAKAGDLPKFYIAVTRARFSVAFVT